MSKKIIFKKTLWASATVALMVTSAASCFASALPSNEILLNALNPVDDAAFGKGKGVKVTMRVQGESVGLPFEDQFFARSDISDGPSDSQLRIIGNTRRATSKTGDYSGYPFRRNQLSVADSISVYGNLRLTYDLFQSDLMDVIRLYPDDKKVRQAASTYLTSTTDMPLYYFVKGEEMENAYYTRFEGTDGNTYRLMNLGWYRLGSKKEYTAQQPDIIWHEAGHSLVDAARPDLFSDSPQAGAYHEAWGDTNAMFTLLTHGGARKRLIFDVSANLHQNNFLRSMAEEFGKSVLGSDTGLRDLDDDVKDEGASGEVHDKSRVLAGAVYDIVVKAYNDRKRVAGVMPEKVLGEVADILRAQWVYTLTQVDGTPSFTEIGTLLRDALPNNKEEEGYGLPWKTYVEEEFKKRDIVLDGTPDPWEWKSLSGKNWSAHTEKAKGKMEAFMM